MLDTFTFADPQRNLDLNPSELDRLQAMLERVLGGRTAGGRLTQEPPQDADPQPQGAHPGAGEFR